MGFKGYTFETRTTSMQVMPPTLKTHAIHKELVVSNPRPETSHRDRITASALSASTDEHSWWAEPFHTDGGASPRP